MFRFFPLKYVRIYFKFESLSHPILKLFQGAWIGIVLELEFRLMYGYAINMDYGCMMSKFQMFCGKTLQTKAKKISFRKI